jgi:hypothetical protein
LLLTDANVHEVVTWRKRPRSIGENWSPEQSKVAFVADEGQYGLFDVDMKKHMEPGWGQT